MVGSPHKLPLPGTTWRSTEIISDWTVYGWLCQVREEREEREGLTPLKHRIHASPSLRSAPLSLILPPSPFFLRLSSFLPSSSIRTSSFLVLFSRVPFACDLSGAFVGVQGLVQGQRYDSREGETGRGACGRGQDRGAGRGRRHGRRHGPTTLDSMKIELSFEWSSAPHRVLQSLDPKSNAFPP